MQINAIPSFKGIIKGSDGYNRTFAINTDKIVRMEGIKNQNQSVYLDEMDRLKLKPVTNYITTIYFDNETNARIPHDINKVIEGYQKVVNDPTAVVDISLKN